MLLNMISCPNKHQEKVGMLHSITQNINGEVSTGNQILGGLFADMENAQGGLGGTMSNIKNMMNSGSGNHMYVMVAFVVLIFFLMYFFMR